jgi:hypothetical protein
VRSEKQSKNRCNNSECTKQLGRFKKTYGIGRPLQAVGFWAALVPDLPHHDAGDPVCDLLPGDLPILPPGWVPMTPVLKGRVDPLLDLLREPSAEGYGHRGPRQTLR